MIAAVRVRGTSGVRKPVSEEMDRMGLTKSNSCVVLKEDESVVGRLKTVEDYVTWGELDEDGARAIVRRADVSNRKKLTEENSEQITGYTLDELAASLADGEVTLTDVGLKGTVGMHPPRKGYKDTNRAYPTGSLGFRGDDINELLRRMR